MKKHILAACVAALSLSAAGCHENESTSTQVSNSNPHPGTARVSPRVEPKSSETVALAGSSEQTSVLDAGVPLQPEPVDPIALVHEENRIVDHLARSAMLREEGDLDGALAEARRAVYDSPEDVDALSAVDRLGQLMHDRTLRVNALSRVAKLKPDDATPLITQARVLLSMKQFDDAIATANEALERDDTNPEVFQALGRAYLSRRELTPAIANFQKVLSLDAEHGYALNNLGFAYLRANRNAEAVEVLTHAAQVLPNVAYVHNNLGIALERMGRTDDAKAEYMQASFLSPKYVKAQVNASRIAALTPKEDVSSDGTMSDVPLRPLSEDPTEAPSDE